MYSQSQCTPVLLQQEQCATLDKTTHTVWQKSSSDKRKKKTVSNSFFFVPPAILACNLKTAPKWKSPCNMKAKDLLCKAQQSISAERIDQTTYYFRNAIFGDFLASSQSTSTSTATLYIFPQVVGSLWLLRDFLMACTHANTDACMHACISRHTCTHKSKRILVTLTVGY